MSQEAETTEDVYACFSVCYRLVIGSFNQAWGLFKSVRFLVLEPLGVQHLPFLILMNAVAGPLTRSWLV